MRGPPERLRRLPDQYFAALLARVAAAAAQEGEPLVNLGRGNPEVGAPSHVVMALARSAARDDVHGYAPFRGLPELKEAVAERYLEAYGVRLDPATEVAIVPGAKTALCELALVCAEHGEPILLPDPGYPDYFSAVALAGGRVVGEPDEALAMAYLNYPSNPTAACAPPGAFAAAVELGRRTGAVIVHDLAYGDLVFDGRRPESFLAEPGAAEVGVEVFSMSKSYGMAGWRVGFVVGNAEIVSRLELYADHVRSGVFMPIQYASIAALGGPQDSVEERRATYEARRDRTLAALGAIDAQSEGTFFVWLRLPEGVTAERLLSEHRVAMAPGEGFGARGAGYARLSLAVPDDVLDRGLERLAGALGN